MNSLSTIAGDKMSKGLIIKKDNFIPVWAFKLCEWANANEISDEDFPRNFKELSNLKILSICNSNITELPKEIGNLSTLTMLYLSDNNFTELPKEIGQLSNLTELDISFNNLTELPKEIGNLSKL